MRLLRSLARAVVLGVATIFQPKARPDDHWSTSPTAVIDEEQAADAGGEPDQA